MYVLLLMIVAIEYSGIATSFPFLQVLHFTTLLSYCLFIAVLVRMNVRDIFSFAQSRLLLSLLLLATASMAWAVVGSVAFTQVRAFADYTILFVLTAVLVNSVPRFFGLVLTLSITTIYLAVMNVDTLISIASTGSRTSYFQAPYFMGDGNDFSWVMVMILPLAITMMVRREKLLWRGAGAFATCACIGVIFGCGSRGAALGLLGTAAIYVVFLSKRRVVGFVTMGICLAALLAIAPSTYTSRVKSIGGYQQDNSAQGRLQAWRAATQMAIDWPLGVGAGNFSRAYGRYYIPDDNHNVLTNRASRWIAPHSIYFQTLAEHGLPGLLIFFGILYTNLRGLVRVRQQLRQSNAEIGPPTALLLSVIGFAICGVFLGGLTYPHLYLLTGMVVGLQRAIPLSVPTSSPAETGTRLPRSPLRMSATTRR